MAAPRKPPCELTSIVSYNRRENEDWIALSIQVGNSYEVRIRGNKTSKVVVVAIDSDQAGYSVKVEWLYSKQEALDFISNVDNYPTQY